MIRTHDLPVRYGSEKRQNITLARNAGIDYSNAEYIWMIDDDGEQVTTDCLDSN